MSHERGHSDNGTTSQPGQIFGQVPTQLVFNDGGGDPTASELLATAEASIQSYVAGISESNNGGNSANVTSLGAAVSSPAVINKSNTVQTLFDSDIVAQQWIPDQQFSFDLAQLSWLRGDDVAYQDRSFSLIIGFTAGSVRDVTRTTTTTYSANNGSYSNGTSSSGVIVEREDVSIDTGTRDGGCGASLAFNVYKEYEDFSVTYAIGVSYAIMTDEVKALAREYVSSGGSGYYPFDTSTLGSKMTFSNSTDIIDGAWLGISFSF